MSTYVIGDVHGCYGELSSLLEKLRFDPSVDKVIFVGDLVGRGPHSLEVVELIMGLGEAAIHVIGNHDLIWLGQLLGIENLKSPEVLSVGTNLSQKQRIIDWLSSSKLLYCDDLYNTVITHAGISPEWSLEDAKTYAEYYESYKASRGLEKMLRQVFAPPTLQWSNDLSPEQVVNYTALSFTRMKFCRPDGSFDLQHQCAPGQQPTELIPWYCVRHLRHYDTHHILFGHWAALGLYQDERVLCCDTGCVWGGSLTAIEVSNAFRIHQVQSHFNANSLPIDRRV